MSLMINKFDYAICLSSSFLSKFRLNKSLIIPGIVNSSLNFFQEKAKENKKGDLVVLFAGGLNLQNGVDLLLNSIEFISYQNISLKFLGRGELLPDIVKASERDNRVEYIGVKFGDELVRELMKADVLINPRPIDKEYTKTSFPSKLIEYMSTGTPTLTTRLESIPNEIKDCFFYIDFPTPQSIASAIQNLYDLDQSQRIIIGQRAKEKALSLYSETVAGEKIYNFVNQ